MIDLIRVEAGGVNFHEIILKVLNTQWPKISFQP